MSPKSRGTVGLPFKVVGSGKELVRPFHLLYSHYGSVETWKAHGPESTLLLQPPKHGANAH